MKIIPVIVATLVLLALPTSSVEGAAATATPTGSLYFNDATDTIAIDGQTELATDATYEALIYFPASTGAGGIVFNEWKQFFEDKWLIAGPGVLSGYNFSTGPIISFSTTIPLDTWHHVAFVKDQGVSEQRLYLDGALVATSGASGDIADSDGPGIIGAIFRDGSLSNSFRGFIDTFRISDIARYSGASFTAPTGDLVDDANTILLYNFNEPDFFADQGQVKITDLSGNGRTGTLGVSSSATPTSPVPPATLGDVDCNGTVNAVDALKLLRFSAVLSVSQTAPCPGLAEALLSADFGDVDCNQSINAVDALKVLRYLAGLSVEQTQPCPEFNDPV